MGRPCWWGVGAFLAAGAAAALVLRGASEGEVRDASAVADLYDRLAPGYDAAVTMLTPFGAPRMRQRAVDLLDLRPGATVVDLGCGTGINQPLLTRAVGPEGHVVGIDLSAGMLHQAQQRAERDGLTQVTVQRGDLREVSLPPGTSAVLATFCLEMVPEHDAVVRALTEQLRPVAGRLAVLGVRRSPSWPQWALALGRYATVVFGVTRAYEEIQPWRSVCAHMDQVAFETAAAGAVYLSVGRAGAPTLSSRHLESA